MTIQDRQYVLKHRCAPYSDNWHHHNYLLAEAVRKWRETNTLKAVK